MRERRSHSAGHVGGNVLQAEAPIEASSRFWSLALCDSPHLAFALDSEKRVLAASGALATRLGCEPDELVGGTCERALRSDCKAGGSCPFSGPVLDGASHGAEVHCEALDGDFYFTVMPFPGPDGRVAGALHLAQDISERKRREAELRDSEELLRQSQHIAHMGHYVLDIATGLWTSSAALDEIFGIDRDYVRSVEGWLGIVHPDDRADMGSYLTAEVLGKQLPFDRDYRIVRVSDGAARWVHGLGKLEEDANGRLSRMFGVIQDVTEAVQAAEALREREERLQRALAGTVAALGATVEMRDPYTAGHERRVAQLACLIAERLGWERTEVELLRTAALVHDLGKIAVPAEILSKPTKLTEMEFSLVKGHARAGYDILAPIAFGSPIADVVLQHHERLDGSGYPDGLTGEAILPAARILAIADVVEAMVSHRPYRAARPLTDAVTEISQGSGVLYDRQAAAACLELIREEHFLPFAVAGSD